MSRWIIRTGWALTLALPIMVAARVAGASPTDAPGAEALYRSALSRIEQDDTDARRMAIQELDRASHLDGTRTDIWLALGHLCLETGQGERGRKCLTRCAALSPADSALQLELGLAWKQDWLDLFERSSLEQADECVSRACTAAPGWAESWSALAMLRVLEGRPHDALESALRASAADPEANEPGLALGCALYRLGDLADAEAAFRVARTRLAPEVLRTIDAIQGGGAGDPNAPPAATSLRIADPDLTTPENEAELDFMTRAALALFLFRDRGRLRWDKRAELFVRYGPPASVVRNPVDAALEYVRDRHVQIEYAPDPIGFPFSAQRWLYPELGITVMLWDQSLTGVYKLPITPDHDPDPRPDPALLAARSDLVTVGNGLGVFHGLPPGASPMTARGAVTRFPDSIGVHLVAHVVTPGAPGDSLWGAWAIVDAAGHGVARGGHVLSASACDPAVQQVADFDATLRPGTYRIDLSVSGAGRRRGLVHLATTVAPPAPGLAMSDLVLLCGDQATSVGPGGIRIEPDFARRFSGSGALTAYFEIARLAIGADGSAHFSYHYAIRRTGKDSAGASSGEPAFEASREESNAASLRRQFISAPMKSLGPGAYRLEVEVRDLVSGASITQSAEFVKE